MHSKRLWSRALNELIERDVIVIVCVRPSFCQILWRLTNGSPRGHPHRPGLEFYGGEVRCVPRLVNSTAIARGLLERKYDAVYQGGGHANYYRRQWATNCADSPGEIYTAWRLSDTMSW